MDQCLGPYKTAQNAKLPALPQRRSRRRRSRRRRSRRGMSCVLRHRILRLRCINCVAAAVGDVTVEEE